MKRRRREAFLKKTKEKTQEILTSRDILLGRISRTIEELNDVINELSGRLKDMYDVYFPELDMQDNEKLIQIVAIFEKGKVDAGALSKIVGSGKANEIINHGKKSAGGEFTEEDIFECRRLAQAIKEIFELKAKYEDYLEKVAKEICPNMAYVAGAAVAAKLIAHVGSLRKLALLPASTIQVLGAERALFKHLKNKRVKPPKHGIIFQHPKISNSPKKVRGKIARTLASKIASAAKADSFTQNFIAKDLKDQFDRRVEDVLKNAKKVKE